MSTTKRAVVVTSAAALALLGLSSPASAHDTRYDGPYACGVTGLQSCGYGRVIDNHQVVEACDGKADGHGYSTWYQLRNGETGRVGDGNGASSGCGSRRVGSSSNPVAGYTVCVDLGFYYCHDTWKLA